MARRKRKAVARRRTSHRRRRGTTARRRVYAANPRRAHRRRQVARKSTRRRYRRNPGMGGIVGSVVQLGIGAGGVLAGRAAYNFANTQFGASLVSATDTVTTAAAKRLAIGAVLGVGITMLGKKLNGQAKMFAEYAAVGALTAPLAQLVVAMAPSTSTYLSGNMAMPGFPSMQVNRISAGHAGGVSAYAPGMAAYAGGGGDPIF